MMPVARKQTPLDELQAAIDRVKDEAVNLCQEKGEIVGWKFGVGFGNYGVWFEVRTETGIHKDFVGFE